MPEWFSQKMWKTPGAVRKKKGEDMYDFVGQVDITEIDRKRTRLAQLEAWRNAKQLADQVGTECAIRWPIVSIGDKGGYVWDLTNQDGQPLTKGEGNSIEECVDRFS